MDVDAWTLNTVLFKWLIYGGSAAAIGGIGIATLLLFDASTRPRIPAALRFTGIGCAVGLIAIAVNFFLQVGAFADDGVSGLFDVGIMALLWQSAVGEALALRALGFVALVTLSVGLLRWPRSLSRPGARWMVILCIVAGIGLIGASFGAIGHSTEHGLLAQVLIVAHVLGVLWWIGALIPLWQACGTLPVADLRALMHRFGQLAVGVVAMLLVCGAALIVLYLDSPDEMITTPYGIALSLKISAVLLLLGVAARHKWRLVPLLVDPAATLRLRISIGIEIVIAALILMLTAILSTVLSPAGLV
ncbi:MAG: CopD family protein [Gammaproteobacteria bacterium]|nr:CopD family protein [Gammaproteobacteria bacterium]